MASDEVTTVGGAAFLTQFRSVVKWVADAPEDPVPTFSALVVDPSMRKAASNTVGAHLRVAYWLSAALRVAYYHRREALKQGNLAAAIPSERVTKLEIAAVGSLAAAAIAAGINASYYTTGWVADLLIRASGQASTALRSSDRKDIRAVYARGMSLATAYSSPRARKELQQLAALKPPVDRTGVDLVLDPDNDGKANISGWVWVFGGVVLVGGALFVASPYVEILSKTKR